MEFDRRVADGKTSVKRELIDLDRIDRICEMQDWRELAKLLHELVGSGGSE